MKNNKKGFTIVECVVAMMIVAMISTLAIVVFQSTVGATNTAWEKYQTTLMADNALSCFKGSVDIDTFEEHFLEDTTPQVGSLNVASHTTVSEEIQVETGSYLEYNPERSLMPTQFVTVRAYEDGRVSFFNKALNINSDSYTPMTTFSYTTDNAQQYKNDVHDASYSLDKCGIYSASYKYNKGLINSITVDYNYDNSSKEHITYTVSYSKVTITRTDKKGKKTTVEGTPTKIEKEYLSKGWFVKLYDGFGYVSSMLSFRGYDFLRLEVWDAVNNKKAQDENGKYLNICLIGEDKSGSSWNDSSGYFSVEELRIAAVSSTDVPDRPKVLAGKITSYNDYTGVYDTEPFNWYYLPTYIVDAYNDFNPATNITAVNPGYDADTLAYTQYTVNSGHLAEIYYALSGGTNIQLFNDCEMLYQYTGETGLAGKKLTELPIAFDRIRVYDAGKVMFFNNSTKSAILTYSYDDLEAFDRDTAASFVLQADGGNYTRTRQVWSKTELNAGNVKYTVQRKNDGSYYSEVAVGNTSYRLSGSSELEKQLMANARTLYFDENSVDSTNNCFYFYVYDANNQMKYANSNGEYMYLKVSYDTGASKTSGDWNKSDGMYFSITKVEVGYSVESTISALRKSSTVFSDYTTPDGKLFFKDEDGANQLWRCFPSYVYTVCVKKSLSYQAFENSYNASEYWEYTLKNGTSAIATVSEGSTGFILSNKEGVILYTNTAATDDNTSEAVTNSIVAQLQAELGLVKTENFNNSGIIKYYRVAGAKSVNKVVFNDTARTITFTDDEGNIAYVFDYSADTLDSYNSDKNEIVNEDGSFHEFYDGTNLLVTGNAVLRKGTTEGSSTAFYNLVVNENIIFNSYAHIVKVQSANIGDDSMFDLQSQVGEETESSITKYYSYLGPNTGFIAQVTYPTDTSYLHVKSSIRVWLMSNADAQKWLQDNNIEGATAIEPTKAPSAFCCK